MFLASDCALSQAESDSCLQPVHLPVLHFPLSLLTSCPSLFLSLPRRIYTQAEPIFEFGQAHRNTVCFSPHGRFVVLAGFGNLAGEMDFWDRNKQKLMGRNTSHCAVAYGWSPCGRYFMTATLAPRMNVDNGVKVRFFSFFFFSPSFLSSSLRVWACIICLALKTRHPASLTSYSQYIYMDIVV